MLGVAFLTCTPSRWTSSGRRGRASWTRFCVSICATLRSVPIRKVTVTVSLPSPVDWLFMYSMFSTPLICCSSGVATVRETVSAEEKVLKGGGGGFWSGGAGGRGCGGGAPVRGANFGTGGGAAPAVE